MSTKLKVNMLDINVSHASSHSEANSICGGGAPRLPENVEYVWGKTNWEGVSIFTDKRLHLVNSVNSKLKVAWLMEPRLYDTQAYELVTHLESSFDLILTHDESLLNRKTFNYKFLPSETNIIEDSSIKIYEKSKMTSFIYSDKTFLPGHKVRFEIANFLKSKKYSIDSYGHGCNPVKKKADALKDYMFSIAVENNNAVNYFTDKILDCFVTGVVPVYWGCPNVSSFFNKEGILHFTTIEELEYILNNLSHDLYFSMLPFVRENFEKAKLYMCLDDIVVNIIRDEFKIGDI